MLGNGYKAGAKDKISAIDCALFLSKIIYHDLVVAQATAVPSRSSATTVVEH